jgi:hypothetical protein
LVTLTLTAYCWYVSLSVTMLSASSVLEKQHGENVETMKNTELAEAASVDTDDMRDEYRFDYSKAKPNRFADKMGQDRLMIVLDPDVRSSVQDT